MIDRLFMRLKKGVYMKSIRGLQMSYYINLFGGMALLVLAVLMLTEYKSNILLTVDIVIVVLSMLAILYFGIRCVINAVELYRSDNLQTLRKYMKVAKRGLIPFFIINFIYHFLVIMILIAASRGIFLFGPIPIILIPLVLFTYLAVLFTSSFSIAFIALLKKKGKFNSSSEFWNICIQLMFVLDIIGVIFLLRRFRIDNVVFTNVEG